MKQTGGGLGIRGERVTWKESEFYFLVSEEGEKVKKRMSDSPATSQTPTKTPPRRRLSPPHKIAGARKSLPGSRHGWMETRSNPTAAFCPTFERL
jgi:hypothetical protein